MPDWISDWFDEHRKRERALREHANQASIVEVTGIIPSSGVAKVQSRGDPPEEVVVFDDWRVDKGPIEPGELRLVQEMAGESLAFGSLRGLPLATVVTTKARLFRTDNGAFGIVAGEARVVEPDMVFAAVLERHKSPATFDDPRLGRLTAHDDFGWVGKAKWLGKNCRLAIDHLDDLPTAHALWEDQRRWTTDAIDFACERLLGLKNSSWLDEGEAEISAVEFRAKMKLTSISVETGGAFVFDFDDGGLFWGHTIVVDGNLREGLTDANIAG